VCTLGCPQDAVRGMHLSYVPRALAAGAQLYTRCRAESLLAANGRVYGVAARFLDAAGRPSPHQLRVVAERVVVACGALLTPVFLARNGVAAGEGGLGRHLRVHPTVRVVGRFADEIRAFEEVPQSIALRGLAAEGILIQSQFLPPSTLAASLATLGDVHERALAAYTRLAVLEVMVCEEESEGSVRVGRGGAPVVRHALAAGDSARLLRGIAYAAEVLLAAGAVEVYTGVRQQPAIESPGEAAALAQLDVRPDDLALVAFHPMGTARMSEDPRRGVTTATGRVHGSRQLYVADASLFPASCRAHPMLTVTALGLRLGAEMSAHLGAPL
jgi:choline dehydrogenase-like flavoprotein